MITDYNSIIETFSNLGEGSIFHATVRDDHEQLYTYVYHGMRMYDTKTDGVIYGSEYGSATCNDIILEIEDEVIVKNGDILFGIEVMEYKDNPVNVYRSLKQSEVFTFAKYCDYLYTDYMDWGLNVVPVNEYIEEYSEFIDENSDRPLFCRGVDAIFCLERDYEKVVHMTNLYQLDLDELNIS